MKINVARSRHEDYVETSRDVIDLICGPDYALNNFVMSGVRVFKYGTAEETLKLEEMTVLEKNNPFGESDKK